MDKDRIARIEEMESYLDESAAAIRALSEALDRYAEIQGKYNKLEEYYADPLWLEDLEADEEGLLPDDLKRGVLSEDAVYDLLTEHDDLMEKLSEILEAEL